MAEEKVRNNGKEQEFNFQEWVEQKRARRTALYNKVDEMADKALSDKGVLFDYLTVQAKLGKISVANSLLIAAQNPKATNLRSFEEWKQRGRSVNSGEKGIGIIAPDGEYERSDGTIGMNFEAKKVFDVSQTSGGKVFQRKNPPVKNALKALMTNAPVHIKLDDTIAKNIGALYSEDKKVICVAPGLESEKLFFSVARELARADGCDNTFLCDCAANIACIRYGIAPQDFDQISEEFHALETREKRDALSIIRDTACKITERIDLNLQAERNKNEPER